MTSEELLNEEQIIGLSRRLEAMIELEIGHPLPFVLLIHNGSDHIGVLTNGNMPRSLALRMLTKAVEGVRKHE